MMTSLVSIIIPSYNCRPWIGEAIDSALSQTWRPIEVIVVDDGSTDGTADWASAHYGERIRVFRQSNRGAAAARNTGLASAQGEYIQFLDADDIITPHKLEIEVAYLQAHPECAGVHSDIEHFYDQEPDRRDPWPRRHLFRSNYPLASLVDGGIFHIQSCIFRKEWVDRVGFFDEDLPTAEDWDWILRLVQMGGQIDFVPGESGLFYRVRPGSMSRQRVLHATGCIAVLRKLSRGIPDPVERNRLGIRRAIGKWRFAYGRALVQDGQVARGWVQMALALCADRRGLTYKLTYMALVPWLGPTRTDRWVQQLQRLRR